MFSLQDLWRYWTGLILSISVVLLVSCAETQASVRQVANVESPLNSEAAALRNFLDRRGAIVKRVFNGIGYRNLITTLFASPKECGLIGVVDSPQLPILIPGGVYLLGVNLPSDKQAFCADAPNAAICLSIPDNCRVVDQSIFCDVSLLQRLQFEADEAYFRVHYAAAIQARQAKPQQLYLPSVPHDFMIALADYQQSMQLGTDAQSGAIPEMLRGVKNYSEQYASLSKAMMEWFLIFNVIGHEYAHVEQHSCPFDTEVSIPDMRGLLDRYMELTCSTTNRKEFAADLRSIELSLRVAELLPKLLERRTKGRKIDLRSINGPLIPASAELAAVRRLDGIPHLLMLSALQESAEYEAIVGQDLWRGRALVEQEPTENTALWQYYLHAVENDWETNTPQSREEDAHMLPAIRSLILMSKIHALAKAETSKGIIIQANRLYVGILGQLVAIQMNRCTPPVFARRTRDEANRRAWEFIYSIYAPKH